MAIGHIFRAGQQADQIDRQLQLQGGDKGTEYRSGTTHVIFHFIHASARFEADATAIEGDAFAHQNVGLF